MRFWPATPPPARDVALIRALLSDGDASRAVGTLRSWPEHRATQLLNMNGAARKARVAEVLYKDESERFGVGSFKAAGAAWATAAALAEGRRSSDLGVVVACATDGNHGRAVAWAARRFGCQAVVYLPSHALPERERRILALGARTVRVDGDYDEAVARVQEDAARLGWLLVSDTSDAPGDTGNLRVIAGYALIVEETLDVLAHQPLPTHVFLQAGVGTLAAGIIAQMARRLEAAAPRFVVVEPEAAPCVVESLELGERVPVGGSLETAMDCLAAGRVSATAWPMLRAWVDGGVTIDDALATATVAALRSGAFGPAVATGPSGAAGLAGLLAVSEDADARDRLGLSETSRVLVIGTEDALEDF